MQKNIVYYVSKKSDPCKNGSLQLESDNLTFIAKVNQWFCESIITKRDDDIGWYQFKPLNLFRQCFNINYIILEKWSDNEELMIEFCKTVAETLDLPFEIL